MWVRPAASARELGHQPDLPCPCAGCGLGCFSPPSEPAVHLCAGAGRGLGVAEGADGVWVYSLPSLWSPQAPARPWPGGPGIACGGTSRSARRWCSSACSSGSSWSTSWQIYGWSRSTCLESCWLPWGPRSFGQGPLWTWPRPCHLLATRGTRGGRLK